MIASGCGGGDTTADPDTGLPMDSGMLDAGRDAGGSDAGRDLGVRDLGTPVDLGVDAGPSDVGVDLGPTDAGFNPCSITPTASDVTTTCGELCATNGPWDFCYAMFDAGSCPTMCPANVADPGMTATQRGYLRLCIARFDTSSLASCDYFQDCWQRALACP